jgi:hypothetical protein
MTGLSELRMPDKMGMNEEAKKIENWMQGKIWKQENNNKFWEELTA